MNGRSKTDVAVTVVAFIAAGAALFGAISLVTFFGVCGVAGEYEPVHRDEPE